MSKITSSKDITENNIKVEILREGFLGRRVTHKNDRYKGVRVRVRV